MRRFQKIFTDQYRDCFSYRTAAYVVQAAQFEFMSVIADCGQKVHLVAGLNLSLLMNLCSRMDEDGDTAEIIKACLEEARCSMQYCNELLTADQAVKDEEF